MVRKAIKAGLADDWLELMMGEDVNPSMMTTLKESHYQARQDDDQRKSTVQKVTQKRGGASHKLQGREELQCRTCAHTAIDFSLKTASGGLSSGHGDVKKEKKEKKEKKKKQNRKRKRKKEKRKKKKRKKEKKEKEKEQEEEKNNRRTEKENRRTEEQKKRRKR